jgi:hypothetical protein
MSKTIVGELKDLYVKYGGNLADLKGNETTAEMLDAIEQIMNTGGGLPEVTADDNGKVLSVVNGEWNKADAPAELPAVTSDDNGKVLAVANGAWGKADASGGNNDFVVTYTDNNVTVTADKTFAEIVAAIEADKTVKAKYYDNNSNADYYFNLIQYGNGNFAMFSCAYATTDNVIVIAIAHMSDNSIIRVDKSAS